MALVIDIANQIYSDWQDLDESPPSIPSIVSWLCGNIGKMNDLLGLSLSIINAEIVPELNDGQAVIFAKLYEIYYLGRKVKQNLGAAAFSSVLELKEGNRTVRKINKNEIAKTWLGMLKEAKDCLLALILNYKMNLATPREARVDNPIISEDIAFRIQFPHHIGRQPWVF